MTLKIKKQLRSFPILGTKPYRQVHAHSTGNPSSTAQNEADYAMRRNDGWYTHVVGNGQIIQVSYTNQGAGDVGGGWNYETYGAVELIESHKTKEEFMTDYKLYVELLRQLLKEAGLPLTVDTGTTGLISHAYATAHQPNNYSDHVDPYPYLEKWGISREQFTKDIKNGFNTDNSTTVNKETKGEDDIMNNIQAVLNQGNGTIYLVNFATATYHGLTPEQWKKAQATHKFVTGKEIKYWKQSAKDFDLLVNTYSLVKK